MIRSKSLSYPLRIFFSFHFADSLLTTRMTYCSVFLFLPYLPFSTHSSTFQHAIKKYFLCAFHFLFSNNFIISSIFLWSCKNRAREKLKRHVESMKVSHAIQSMLVPLFHVNTSYMANTKIYM